MGTSWKEGAAGKSKYELDRECQDWDREGWIHRGSDVILQNIPLFP